MKTGKHEAMTPYEMDEMNLQTVASNHLYDNTGGRSETVAEIVRIIAEDISKDRKRVSLTDTEAVKRVTLDYIASCERTPLLPSKSGLCRALGYSRKGVYLFMRDNYGHPTEDYLSRVFDGFSEAYDVAAMGGSIHPVYAIFTQKAQYGLNDRPVEEPEAKNLLGEITPLDELITRYADTGDTND